MPMSPYVRELRAAVGQAKLLMPSVAGIIRDESGERILLVQARDGGRWSTPGGSLEIDDTPADAVIREVWEETGLAVEIERIAGVYGGPEAIALPRSPWLQRVLPRLFSRDGAAWFEAPTWRPPVPR